MTNTRTIYKHVELSEDILKSAQDVNLRDLLESPTYQSWVLSAIGNGGRFASSFEGSDNNFDEWLQFRLQKLYFSVPRNQLQSCFDATNTLIKENKKAQEKTK